MARYFFDLHECGTVTADDEGREWPDLAAARAEALRTAREMMCAEVKEGRLCLTCNIEVKDAAGAIVLSLAFRDAVEISGLN